MELITNDSMCLEIYEPDAFTIPERVTRFLFNHQPHAYCDDCLADALRLRRAQISIVTSTLGLCRDYTRGGTPCLMCGRVHKLATHRNQDGS